MRTVRQWVIGAAVIFCVIGWLVGAVRAQEPNIVTTQEFTP